MACLIGYDNNQFIGTQIGTRKDFKKYDLGFFIKIPLFFMVSRAGFEPATCPLGGGFNKCLDVSPCIILWQSKGENNE